MRDYAEICELCDRMRFLNNYAGSHHRTLSESLARTTRIYLEHAYEHAQIVSGFENIRFRSSTQSANSADYKKEKSTLRGFKKMRFRRADSLVSCRRKTDSHINICGFKNIRIRVDGA